MQKFKPGDRVVLPPEANLPHAGLTATVGPKGIYTGYGDYKYLDILWNEPKYSDGGYLPGDFELSTAGPTDQELADKYRQLRSEAWDIHEEMERRGFTLWQSGSPTFSKRVEMKFTKTEKKEL